MKSAGSFWKRIGVRLWLWYSGIFIAIALILLILSHWWISSVLTNRDHSTVQSRIQELSKIYQQRGAEAIQEVSINDQPEEPDSYFVRLANPQNQTVILRNAEAYDDFNVAGLQQITPSEKDWIIVRELIVDDEFEPLKKREVLEVRTLRLPDGNFLQAGRSTEYREDFLAAYRVIFAASVFPLFLFAGTLLSLRSLRPLRTMISTVRSIQSGRMDSRVPVRHTGDELDQLAILFNQMLEQIESLIHGMRNSLDVVAHDLRTPMMRLRSVAESALQSEPNTGRDREALADCLEEADRIDQLLNVLMDISEAETGAMKLSREQISVPALMQESIELYQDIAEGKNIGITTKVPADLTLNGDWNRMRQVLANLLDNAIKYTGRGGKIELEAFHDTTNTVILMKDTGVGIPADELPRIWDRLYRADNIRAEKGIGLGLSLVRAVVKAHGGSVAATSEPGKGTTFKLVI